MKTKIFQYELNFVTHVFFELVINTRKFLESFWKVFRKKISLEKTSNETKN